MVVFLAYATEGGFARFDEEETSHCIKVLRNKKGDIIHFIDGKGRYFRGEITEIGKHEFVAKVVYEELLQRLPYKLHMYVAPLKNADRYEWFMEKVTEIGVESITPVITAHSEKKSFKRERAERLVLSSVKQSLKGFIPVINEPVPFADVLKDFKTSDSAGFIGFCGDYEKKGLSELLKERFPLTKLNVEEPPVIKILIGPEGDFTDDEAAAAAAAGFEVVHLGPSRLRTETAAVVSAAAVYLYFTN